MCAEALLEQVEAGIVWPQAGSSFWEQPPRKAPLPVAPPAGAGAGAKRDPRQLHIVHVTAEMAPVAKVSLGCEGYVQQATCEGPLLPLSLDRPGGCTVLHSQAT